MAISKSLVAAVEAALIARADPAKAGPMQAYMKSAMPFLGVQARDMRAACKEAFARVAIEDEGTWRDTCLALWRGARHREERYAALELTGHRPYRVHWNLRAMPMFEEMIVDGAWWDYVDLVATARVGPILERHPAAMKAKMRAWSKGANMWKRRTSILCQLKMKERTDRGLLYDCIEPSIESKEFFLKKAIGWALRELAKTDPEEVRRYVEAHAARLSGLSKREALKHLG